MANQQRDHSGASSSRTSTIRFRILLGFGSLMLLIALLGTFTLFMVRSIDAKTRLVAEQSVPATKALGQALLAASENRMAIYKHVSSPSQKEMDEVEATIARNGALYNEAMKTYKSLASSQEALQLLEKVQVLVAKIRDHRIRILAASRKADNPETSFVLLTEVRSVYDPLTDQFSKALTELQDMEQATVQQRCLEMEQATGDVRKGTLFGCLVILVLGIAAAIVISARINKALVKVSDVLQDSSGHVNSASGQVAASSQGVAEGSSEQAASLEETSASLEELSGMTQKNAESARNATNLAREARSATEAGSSQVNELVGAMSAIKESSDNIAVIIKTIDEIAFQTNILALNAAVEAARAGEAGAGFAVVADEVRSLAQRAASAAKETAGKIDEAISKSSRGAEVSDRVSKSLALIADKVRQVDHLVGEIATASQEQAQGIGQIGTAVSQMDQVTQRNASQSEETASAAQELSTQSQVLQGAVNDLRLLVLGRA